MALINRAGQEVSAKIVYYGPGLSGKTTNLEIMFKQVPETNRGKMISMKTRTDRTLFFDLLPINSEPIHDFQVRILLYTVPGQVYYNATRRLVLKGVDAVVYVADSQRDKLQENIESLENLHSNLADMGLEQDAIPLVIQYNKRDLPDIMSIEELQSALNTGNVPYFEAVASRGDGVHETMRGVVEILRPRIKEQVEAEIGMGAKPDSTREEPRAPEQKTPLSRDSIQAPQRAETDTWDILKDTGGELDSAVTENPSSPGEVSVAGIAERTRSPHMDEKTGAGEKAKTMETPSAQDLASMPEPKVVEFPGELVLPDPAARPSPELGSPESGAGPEAETAPEQKSTEQGESVVLTDKPGAQWPDKAAPSELPARDRVPTSDAEGLPPAAEAQAPVEMATAPVQETAAPVAEATLPTPTAAGDGGNPSATPDGPPAVAPEAVSEAVSEGGELLLRVPRSFLESGELRLRIVLIDQKHGEAESESLPELIEQT